MSDCYETSAHVETTHCRFIYPSDKANEQVDGAPEARWFVSLVLPRWSVALSSLNGSSYGRKGLGRDDHAPGATPGSEIDSAE